MSARIKLTKAQFSALEARDFDLPSWASVLTKGRWLVFPAQLSPILAEHLCDASNSEDAHAQMLCGQADHRLTIGATHALSNLSVKVGSIKCQ